MDTKKMPFKSSPGSVADEAAQRRDWLSVLARAPREALLRHARLLGAGGADGAEGFERLRGPEIGLTMLRARVGNQGDRFNLGEATLTRCVVRHRDEAGSVTAGVGYVLGRDPERAEWVARFDALLLQPRLRGGLLASLIEPLREAVRTAAAEQAARTAASRVRFHTLQPESTGGLPAAERSS